MGSLDAENLELKVFTLPTCSSCQVVKQIALEVARKLGLTYREINMNTKEGLEEGAAHQVMSVPGIVLGSEVIVVGRLLSKEKLEEEVRRRLEKWRAKALTEKVSSTPSEG